MIDLVTFCHALIRSALILMCLLAY